MINEIVCGVLMVIGTIFMFIAALGVFRMPDFYLRMATSSKAATLGSACVLLALAFYFADLGTTTRALAAIVFLFMTTPISAHMLGRAAYCTGVPLWKGTVLDELKGRYDTVSHELAGIVPLEQPGRAEPPHQVEQS